MKHQSTIAAFSRREAQGQGPHTIKRGTPIGRSLLVWLGVLALFGATQAPLEAQFSSTKPKGSSSPCDAAIPSGAPGLLVKHPDNGRYFMEKGDPQRKVVYLTGSHVWGNIQDFPSNPSFDTTWQDNLDVVLDNGHNFIRGWTWEDDWYAPLPYTKSGGDFDLDSYNDDFFDDTCQAVLDAARQGVYVSVMLFQGWSIEDKPHNGGPPQRNPNPWPRHPYAANNNNNNINGDVSGGGSGGQSPDGLGKETHTLASDGTQIDPRVLQFQKAYVSEVISRLGRFPNIIWEITNESHEGAFNWQEEIISHIRSVEPASNRHLIWMNHPVSSELFSSSADIVSPSGFSLLNNPPAWNGSQVSILDTDHLGGINSAGTAYIANWKQFLRGHHVVMMDPLHNLEWFSIQWDRNLTAFVRSRASMGHILDTAERIDLANMVPRNDLSSTGYCLANPGQEYLVYQPNFNQGFTITLEPGTYEYTSFDSYPDNSNTPVLRGVRTVSSTQAVSIPNLGGRHVVHFTRMGDANPTARYSFSCNGLTCNFDASASSDDVGISNYTWNFGDGTGGSGVTTSRTYNSAGSRTVTLTVTDTAGQTDQESKTVTVTGGVDNPPEADFTFSCNHLSCTFDASGSSDDFGISNYAWNFGNGSTASGVTTAHSYASGGNYNVTLTVTDTAGQTDSTSATVSVSAPPTNCTPGTNTLCLNNNRFRVTLNWNNPTNGSTGLGRATPHPTENTAGFFWFFSANNLEVGVKVLDAGAINNRFWVFHGAMTTLDYSLTVTDTVSGETQTYQKTGTDLCGGADTGSFEQFTGGPGQASAAAISFPVDAATSGASSLGSCISSPQSLCLLDNRFKVEVIQGGGTKPVVPLNTSTGAFYFFSSNNPEVFVKMLDGGVINGKVWLLYGSMTDQGYQVRVTDTVSGQVKTYNPPGPNCGDADLAAFPS